MGGSQVFSGREKWWGLIKYVWVHRMVCVVMAEHLAGSEEEFVKRMNEKAGELGMLHTQV